MGTAGAIDDEVEGGIYDIAGAIQHDVKDLDGTFGAHVSLPTRVETGHDGLIIATGDHFVDDADTVRLIRGLGLAWSTWSPTPSSGVAQQFGVPIRITRAVSDRAQDGATELWDDVVRGAATSSARSSGPATASEARHPLGLGPRAQGVCDPERARPARSATPTMRASPRKTPTVIIPDAYASWNRTT